DQEPAKNAIITTEFKNVDLLPASMDLAGAELELVEIPERQNRLKAALAEVKEDYDYILLDCPPSLGLITLNALTASDSFLVPIQCEYYALEGLSQLLNTVKTIKRLYNPSIDLEGVVLTMFDNRLNLTQQVVAEVKKYFPNKVFETAIPRNVRLSEAPSFGMPVLYYDRGSRGSMAYIALARELIKKNTKR
ncbi:MAG: ParA family protein, partial [Acutalibacteraceae bacterium]|nr:ParA family protein [Acutalibacteraceae bacterium]